MNNIAQRAALEALTGSQNDVEEMHAAFNRRRTKIVDGLNAIDGVHCPSPKGAFYAYPDVRGLLGKEIAVNAPRLLPSSPSSSSKKLRLRWFPVRLSALAAICAFPMR